MKESEENHKCSICSDSQTHTWEVDLSGDKNHDGHTLKCTIDGCTATKTETHTLTLNADGYNGDKEHTIWCEQCQYSEQESHTPTPVVLTEGWDPDTHDVKCTVCEKTYTKEEHKFDQEGDAQCRCGYTKPEEVTPTETVLDFVSNFTKTKITQNSYETHKLTASNFGVSDIDFNLTLMDASKQNVTITNCPVTKSKFIILKVTDANLVGKIKFEFKQWDSNTLGTMSLTVTYDSGKTATITGTTAYTQEFDLSSYTGVYKVELKSSNVDKQAGISKITFNYIPAVTPQDQLPTYTLDCCYIDENHKNTNYDSSTDIEVNGITWNIQGNTTMKPWRFGGKKLTTATNRSLTSKTPITQDIGKIIIQFGVDTGSITVNSVTLYVYKSDPTLGSPAAIAEKDVTYTKGGYGKVIIENSDNADWSNCYYRITFNVKVSGSSNKSVSIESLEFWEKEA